MIQNYELRHLEQVRRAAPECMVLLKSDGSFPLAEPGQLALYGSGARRTLKGGRGSGDVNVRACKTAEEALEDAGFTVTTKCWLNAYEKERQSARAAFRAWLKEKIAAEGLDRLMENLSIVMPEPEYTIPLNASGDTAVYVLSRLSGEGTDRQNVPGDFLLTETEIRDILLLQRMYRRFLLVLNVCGVVDLSPVARSVSNILLLSQLGSVTGEALADVLLGKTYPSGKLAASWGCADDYAGMDFGGREDVCYREGIYSGYRFFDAFSRQPVFPFGFGLGYTTFSVTPEAAVLQGSRVECAVRVKNTGSYPGKETVQLYVSVPEGELDQPPKVLAAFRKSGELLPGQEETLRLSFALEELASTDVQKNAQLLESGRYVLYIGTDSRQAAPYAAVELAETIPIRLLSADCGRPDFTDIQPGRKPEDPEVPVIGILNADDFSCETPKTAETDREALAIAEALPDSELAYLCTGEFVGDGSRNVFGDSARNVPGAAGETSLKFLNRGVPNVIMSDGPAGVRIAREYIWNETGAHAVDTVPDGVYNLENPLELIPDNIVQVLRASLPLDSKQEQGELRQQNCTAIPTATAIAQSWSPEIAAILAHVVAEELEYFGIHIWLAPAMNIQRHPLCGRNFEYYSEDPLLSGKLAAAVTKAVQSHPGRCVTLKHFICNNQETNRFRSNSVVSPRALRDLYARGFEIAVKEGQPLAVMSSYNLLNGVHTSERYDLLTVLLREEWGFTGTVISDFIDGDPSASDAINRYRKFTTAPSIKAGCDLVMPGGIGHYSNILQGLRDGSLTRRELQLSASRVISLARTLSAEK